MTRGTTRQLRISAGDLAALVASARAGAAAQSRPYVLAIDGRSGAGKSTLANRLAAELGACLVDGDSFFAGGVEVRRDSPEARTRACIDWRRQRSVLEVLRLGGRAQYHAFDWEAFDGSLEARPTMLDPAPFVILEGVYSARAELSDLVDLRVVLTICDATRDARLLAREGGIGPWERQWHEAETWYFESSSLLSEADVVVNGDET